MDERKLDCCVVRDLLPSYLEGLTEEETARAVAAHLESCEACRKLAEDLRRDIPLEKAPKRALNFLKKVKRTRLLAAALSALLKELRRLDETLCSNWLPSADTPSPFFATC